MDELITGSVGLDAHAESTAIGFAEAGRVAPRLIGTVGPKQPELTKVLGRLGEPRTLLIVHEAGPCGYGLAHELRALGYRCEVVAPSKIPKKADERVKTDRSDALKPARPRELMGYLRLVPSEHTTGAITKTGNGYVRRVLVEAAWNYHFPARVSRVLQIRQEQQPAAIRQIAWRAQLRLSHRYRRLKPRGLQHNEAVLVPGLRQMYRQSGPACSCRRRKAHACDGLQSSAAESGSCILYFRPRTGLV